MLIVDRSQASKGFRANTSAAALRQLLGLSSRFAWRLTDDMASVGRRSGFLSTADTI
ncbi:hypothetical protein [Pseudomonas sp. dw_358]|uniref:hypothetical protein n=1 Tax=Pseudomonas sp. dw_358 TaxID=2720083 RepID=UPI001BD2B015|nr:hypothetical protein [Pseudomonas sp. dw_358]